MNQGEFVSRVSNQLRMISKDDYQSDRFILFTGLSIAKKFITQKIQRRSIDRDMSLYTEVTCIEFEPVDIFRCKYVEFKSCDNLSKSVKKLPELIYTRYGSSVKELYSIDRKNNFIESTLYQLRNDSLRQGHKDSNNRFYILDEHIYLPREIETLSGLILTPDVYEAELLSGCNNNCESAWQKPFIAPDSMLEDIISFTVQNIAQTKSIPETEKQNLNSNEK